MRMNGKSILAMAMAASVVAFAASSASAAVVYDTITVYDSSDAIIASLMVSEAQQALNPTAINYLGGVAVDPTEDGNYGIVLASGVVVDIFGIASGGPDGLDLAFSPGPGAAGYPIQNPVLDTGAPISLTLYLDPALQAAGDTAFFTASGAFTEGVPEPGTWMLLSLGIFGLGAALRLRGRAGSTVSIKA